MSKRELERHEDIHRLFVETWMELGKVYFLVAGSDMRPSESIATATVVSQFAQRYGLKAPEIEALIGFSPARLKAVKSDSRSAAILRRGRSPTLEVVRAWIKLNLPGKIPIERTPGHEWSVARLLGDPSDERTIERARAIASVLCRLGGAQLHDDKLLELELDGGVFGGTYARAMSQELRAIRDRIGKSAERMETILSLERLTNQCQTDSRKRKPTRRYNRVKKPPAPK